MQKHGKNIQPDEVLFDLIKRDDDQRALEMLFQRYYHRLCDFVFHYVRSFDLTEEIVSDVFLKIWLKRKTLTITQNFKAYLFAATQNQTLNYIQKKNPDWVRLQDLSVEITSETPRPDEAVIFSELQNHIEELINNLPPRRKMIFKLSRIEGFAYREIADILSISIYTVQNQMVQAVKQLSKFAIEKRSR